MYIIIPFMRTITNYFKKAMPFLANFLGGIAVIPELKKVITTWNVDEMEYMWLILSCMANICWIAYGCILQDWGILSLGIIFTLFYTLLITIKLTPQYKKKSTHES